MSDKLRLDNAVVNEGLANSRSAAQAMIIAGEVMVNGLVQTKPAHTISQGDSVEARQKLKYVSRGGLKLEKAMDAFGIGLQGAVCMDVGASTGGFTHCMLLNGAAKVYAVDVGYGQLDYSLRNDERVVCMERYNARELNPQDVPPVDFASIDVSFISLKLVLPAVHSCLKGGGEVVALIKPQFEVGKGQVGKNGVVRDSALHKHVCANIIEFCAGAGFAPLALDYSPIKGPKGNVEFLLHMRKAADTNSRVSDEIIDEVVNNSKHNL